MDQNIDADGQPPKTQKGKKDDFGGTRTHAPEETGALIQRLRPLGHEVGLMTIETESKVSEGILLICRLRGVCCHSLRWVADR